MLNKGWITLLPLEGITVVSIEQAVAAPFATRQLADLGARVIKIERACEGDFARNYDTTVNGLSSHFVWCNRSKESLELDLKSDMGKKVLRKLITKADVFVENLAPNAIDRLGFSSEVLHELNPKLIICSLSGYGNDGPYALKKAYDLLVQCEAGLVSITGTEEDVAKVGIPVADIAAGMYLYSGILTALLLRGKTGKGNYIEISMLEALGEWMGHPAYYAHYGGSEPKRTGASHATIYPYGPFMCSDREVVFLGIQNEREWEKFSISIMENPKLIEDSKFSSNFARVENRETLRTIIENKTKKMTSVALIEKLEKNQIANARINNMNQFFEHKQLKSRNKWENIQTEKGLVKSLLPPVTMKGFKPVMNKVPALGEHNKKILKELFGDNDKYLKDVT